LNGCEDGMIDIVLGSVTAAGLFGYLMLALLRPGRF
jgi:K+-transporting ATPase KdpF subunit